mmetsp:Transcript_48007/g.104386  ORF Transcript_48007/g.104386 Transcript_48007/m.104386 type:complete len:337 (-) Transcript_48007:145-1155(-)
MRSRISSGSSGPGVSRSPLSQQWPTTTHASGSVGSFSLGSSLGTMTMGCWAPYKDGRRISVIPLSVLIKVCPPVAPAVVATLSCTQQTKAQAFATKYVPGSISKCSLRPVSASNSLNLSSTAPPQICTSVALSVVIRAILYPPPKLHLVTVGSLRHRSSVKFEQRVQTSGSLPDPMWVCTRTTSSLCSSTSLCTSSKSPCQMPKEEDGPPTLVLLVPPEPTPGLKRMPILVPGSSCPTRSSCFNEQQLIWTPFLISSLKSSASCWEDREMFSGFTPAAMARWHSNPEEASMCSPISLNNCKIRLLGEAFMAYRTVSPNALGKSNMFWAWVRRVFSS